MKEMTSIGNKEKEVWPCEKAKGQAWYSDKKVGEYEGKSRVGRKNLIKLCE